MALVVTDGNRCSRSRCAFVVAPAFVVGRRVFVVDVAVLLVVVVSPKTASGSYAGNRFIFVVAAVFSTDSSTI